MTSPSHNQSSHNQPSSLQSKKFIAYMGWLVCSSVLVGLGLLRLDFSFGNPTGVPLASEVTAAGLITVMTIVNGFVAVVYIGSQAALDRYVRVAEIVAKGGAPIQQEGRNVRTTSPSPARSAAASAPTEAPTPTPARPR